MVAMKNYASFTSKKESRGDTHKKETAQSKKFMVEVKVSGTQQQQQQQPDHDIHRIKLLNVLCLLVVCLRVGR